MADELEESPHLRELLLASIRGRYSHLAPIEGDSGMQLTGGKALKGILAHHDHRFLLGPGPGNPALLRLDEPAEGPVR